MGQLGTWLLALAPSLVGKVLLALGFQVVTITGVTVAITALKALVLQHLGAVPAAGLQLALLGGAGEALGMIFGAVAARVALWSIQNSSKILGVAS